MAAINDSSGGFYYDDSNGEYDSECLAENSDSSHTTASRGSLNDGSLTPMIHRAIRRSIHQFSKDSSDEEEVQINDENNIIRVIAESDVSENSDSDHEVTQKMKKKTAVILSDISDDEYVSEQSIVKDSSNEIEDSISPNVRTNVRKSFGEKSHKTHISINLDSSDDKENMSLNSSEDKENISVNSSESELAMSIAVEESKNSSLDPMLAQKKAYFTLQREQIERKLVKTKTLYMSGKMELLPDKGEKLRISIVKHEKELKGIIKDLESLKEQENKLGQSKMETKLKPLFKPGSLDIDPAYTKPTTMNIEKDLGKKAQETYQREQILTIERLKDLHGSLLAKPSEDQRAQDPRGLKVSLMPHQKYALTWLLWREQDKPPGGVLADDMGLGKTLTMISLVMVAKAQMESGEASDEEEWLSSARVQRHLGGTLVVAPASLVAQWESEVKNRCKRGMLTVELHHGNNREDNARRLARNDMVITTYNILTRSSKNNGVLFKIRWRRVILDEAHVIRNHKSQTCESVCALHADKRWVLTGTPVHNKEMDLFAILKFLRCSPFDDVRVWKRWVDNKNSAGHERLATVMKTIMLRRTKEELMANGSLTSLPDKTIELIEITLDPEERLVYDKVMVYSRTLFAQFLAQRAEKAHTFELGAGKYDKPSWMVTYKDTQFTKAQKKLLSMHADVEAHEILVLLLRLRQVCCHPSLIHTMLDKEDIEHDGLDKPDDPENLVSKINNITLNEDDNEEEGEIGVDERVTEHLLTSSNPVFDQKRQSSKMRAILEKIEEIITKGDKTIIVSQWVSVLEIVADQLNSMHGVSHRMFTGKVAVKDRQGIMDDFNSPDSKTNVLLLSLTAGGVGLNLVGANHLLLIDIHWNPQLECQAQDRIYRFGQKKDVYIYKFICTDTIEERIKALQEKKMEIAHNLLSGGGKIVSSKLSLDEMKSLFGL